MSGSNKCEVKGCSGDALHELPEDAEKRRIWTDALNLEEVNYAPNTSVMCTEHFQMLDSIDVGSIASSSKGSSTTSGCSYEEDAKMNATFGSFKAVGSNSVLSNISDISSYDEDDFPLKIVRKGTLQRKGQFQRKVKSHLSTKATAYLKAWLSQHLHYPYPTDKEKTEIAAETDLTSKQVSNWFINARRRFLKPMVDSPYGISGDVNAPALTPQECGYRPRRRPPPKAKIKEEVDMTVVTPCIDLMETPRTSTSSCPSIVDVNVPVLPLQQGVTDAKKPRRRTPAKPSKMKKEVDMLTVATPSMNLPEPPSTNVSTLPFHDSSSSLNNGVENMDVRKSPQKDPAKSAVIRRPKSNGRNILKVVIPAANLGRVKSKNRLKTITPTVRDSQLQSAGSEAPHDYIPATKIAKLANRPKPVSAPAAVEVRPTHPALPHVPSENGVVPNGASSDVSGEDLLDSLYEELYLKSEMKGEDVGSVEELEMPNRGRKRASTYRSTETQTCYDLKHCETQTSVGVSTSSDVHTAALSYMMYQNKPDWVMYHTGLANYKQFKLVLDSLGPGVNYLADRYGTPDKPLCVEDQLLMTLMKLRRAEPNLGIGILFGVPKKTVEDIINTWTNFMYRRWSVPDVWSTQELTARKVCRSIEEHNGTPSSGNPLFNDEKPSDPTALERVRKLYKILNVNLTLHKPFSDNVLFVCCTLYDFRGGVITTRNP
uniref:Homeobox protein PKNOX2 n=2 Tax=Lygus hesperus TaxID=30085 RepID=A0A146KZZ8_LYGHE